MNKKSDYNKGGSEENRQPSLTNGPLDWHVCENVGPLRSVTIPLFITMGPRFQSWFLFWLLTCHVILGKSLHLTALSFSFAAFTFLPSFIQPTHWKGWEPLVQSERDSHCPNSWLWVFTLEKTDWQVVKKAYLSTEGHWRVCVWWVEMLGSSITRVG